jgi:hypothetical protein
MSNYFAGQATSLDEIKNKYIPSTAISINMTSSASSTPSNDCEHSAMILLLKKVASGTSRVLGGMMDLPWDGDCISSSVNEAGIMEGLFDVGTNNEEYGVVADMLSDVFLPYLPPMLKMLIPTMDDDQIKDPITFETSSQSTSRKAQRNSVEDGLILSTPDMIERLDFVITQMDISRMERTASRFPTVTYGSNDLICPPNQVGMDTEESVEQDYPDKENAQDWSWMVVPRDTNEDMSRITSTTLHGVPASISICNSTCSMEDTDSSFHYCVICREHFRVGQVLRVLVCSNCVLSVYTVSL